VTGCVLCSGGRVGGASSRYDRTPMTGMTPSYGGRTPMYGSQTPLYDGSRTPHYGAATPSHDGSSTPGRSSAWDPANTNTPSRSVFLCIAAGDRCCSCCDMESAYVTRLSALL